MLNSLIWSIPRKTNLAFKLHSIHPNLSLPYLDLLPNIGELLLHDFLLSLLCV